ncbi:hypothetical protein HMN09_00356900 [Mycena chlorophos]|uniref:Uncharacterized protein n=1 Tax=Mycena chlorophos TaxID=658473 RepID=A0A8H6TKM7_MYCCL|nr:hypothetical protein HMN09_00356900 [Mycena chlorophos]
MDQLIDSDSDAPIADAAALLAAGTQSRMRRRPAAAQRESVVGSLQSGNARRIVCGAVVVRSAEEQRLEMERSWARAGAYTPSPLPLPLPQPSVSSPPPPTTTTRSTGCGSFVHGAAHPARAGGRWVARADTDDVDPRVVIPLPSMYFSENERRTLDFGTGRHAGCGCGTTGVGCAVCGNALGALFTPCRTHARQSSTSPASLSQVRHYIFLPSAVSPSIYDVLMEVRAIPTTASDATPRPSTSALPRLALSASPELLASTDPATRAYARFLDDIDTIPPPTRPAPPRRALSALPPAGRESFANLIAALRSPTLVETNAPTSGPGEAESTSLFDVDAARAEAGRVQELEEVEPLLPLRMRFNRNRDEEPSIQQMDTEWTSVLPPSLTRGAVPASASAPATPMHVEDEDGEEVAVRGLLHEAMDVDDPSPTLPAPPPQPTLSAVDRATLDFFRSGERDSITDAEQSERLARARMQMQVREAESGSTETETETGQNPFANALEAQGIRLDFDLSRLRRFGVPGTGAGADAEMGLPEAATSRAGLVVRRRAAAAASTSASAGTSPNPSNTNAPQHTETQTQMQTHTHTHTPTQVDSSRQSNANTPVFTFSPDPLPVPQQGGISASASPQAAAIATSASASPPAAVPPPAPVPPNRPIRRFPSQREQQEWLASAGIGSTTTNAHASANANANGTSNNTSPSPSLLTGTAPMTRRASVPNMRGGPGVGVGLNAQRPYAVRTASSSAFAARRIVERVDEDRQVGSASPLMVPVGSGAGTQTANAMGRVERRRERERQMAQIHDEREQLLARVQRARAGFSVVGDATAGGGTGAAGVGSGSGEERRESVSQPAFAFERVRFER